MGFSSHLPPGPQGGPGQLRTLFLPRRHDDTEIVSRTLAFWSFSAKCRCVPSPWVISMSVPNHPTLIRRALQSRLKLLASSTPILGASLCSYTHRCGRPSCRCHHG